MPQEISPQVDVGLLTLNGLAAFTPVLAALTADNVQPMAMVQLENLGSLFHTSGKYAAKVPDLLQRCSSKRIEHLSMSLGWRKGDAASVMSQSAGGQAMALLCFFLRNLYSSENCVWPSFKDVADLLSGKMQALGFGNFLAEKVIWIHKIFEQLKKPVPCDFLNAITKESMADILAALSKAFCEEKTIIRIAGSGGMGYIIALATILFPSDTTISVEDLIVQEGAQRLICLDFKDVTGCGTLIEVEVEKVLNQGHRDCFPVAILPHNESHPKLRFFFQWKGHVADALTILFGDFGITCTSAFLVACSDLLMYLPAMIQTTVLPRPEVLDSHAGSLWSLLGPEPMQQLYHVCGLVLRETPSGKPQSGSEAFHALVRAFEETAGAKFECMCKADEPSYGFKSAKYSSHLLPDHCAGCASLHLLWRGVLGALSRALRSMFVDADPNAIVDVEGIPYSTVFDDIIGQALGVSPGDFIPEWLNGYGMHLSLVNLLGSDTRAHGLAISNGSSALVPKSLLHIKQGLRDRLLYELRDGQIVVNGRYYRHLTSTGHVPRAVSRESLSSCTEPISPSSLGEHSDLSFTVRELVGVAELRATATCQGQSLRLDLNNIIIASIMVQFPEPCKHDPNSALDEALGKAVQVITTSVAAPEAEGGTTIAITQTKENPVAQLLSCGNHGGTIVQRGCCLNCAVTQARKKNFRQIIVG